MVVGRFKGGSTLNRKTGEYLVFDAGTKWNEKKSEVKARPGCSRGTQ